MEPVRLTSPEGVEYRDLNGNGQMDPFEDPRRPVEERVEDLLGRLSLEEKVGLMFHTVIEAGADGSLIEAAGAISKSPTSVVVKDKHLSHFNVHVLEDARMAARWHNALQALAEQTPHGIPVTISTDPRHAFIENAGVSFTAKAFSQWPEPLGLAALRDVDAVRRFADIARQEYVAVGIRAALHPTLDLATEPRWARQAGTFGQDPDLVTELGVGLPQGVPAGRAGTGEAWPARASTSPAAARRRTARTRTSPTAASRSTPAGGSATTSSRSRRSSRPAPPRSCRTTACRSGSRSTARRSRRSASATTARSSPGCCAGSSATTAWSSPTGSSSTTTTSATRCCRRAPGASSTSTRTGGWSCILDAGADQFGGEECVDILLDLVQQGRVSEERVDESARRLLLVKFRLGLFDNPFVDEDAADDTVGRQDFRDEGYAAQARSVTLLQNGTDSCPAACPCGPDCASTPRTSRPRRWPPMACWWIGPRTPTSRSCG